MARDKTNLIVVKVHLKAKSGVIKDLGLDAGDRSHFRHSDIRKM